MKALRLPMDVYAGTLLAFLGGAFYCFALEMSPEAALFPKIVLGAFITLALAMAIRGYIQFKKTGEAKKPLAFEGLRIPLLVFVFITMYVVALDFVGFCLATAAFIPTVALFYKNKKPLHILAATICLIGFIYLLFVVQLNLMLP